MREHRAGLGHDAVEPGEQRAEAGRQRGRDEHRPVRRVLGVVGDRPAADAAAGAGAAADLAVDCTRMGLPRSDSWNRAGQRGAEVVVVRRHERRDDDGPLGGDRLDVVEGHVADQLGLGEVAGRGEALAELPGGPARQLLDPADPQAQRLAQDAVVVAAVAVGAEVDGGRLGRQLGPRARPAGGVRASTTGLRLEDLLVAQPVLAGLDEHPQRHRRAGHPVAAGVGEHAHEDLVGVQRPQDRLAAVEQGDQLAAGELGAAAGTRLEVGVDPVEQVLGEAGAGRARSRPTRHAPRSRRAAGMGLSRCRGPRFGTISPARRRSMATWPSTATTTSLALDLGRRGGAGQQHRLAHRLAQRRDPEVVLELGQRLGERLGHRARAVDRARGARPGSRW